MHTGFVFEAMISFLKRQFHGTRIPWHQIVENTTTVQNIQYFVNKEITYEPPRAVQLAMQLIAPKKMKNVIEVSQHVKFFHSGSLQDPAGS